MTWTGIPRGLGATDAELNPPAVLSDAGGRWALYALDGAFGRAAPLHDFEGEIVLRHNAPGSWAFSFAYAGAAARWLRFLGLGSGIALTRDDQPFFLGLLEERTVEENGDIATLTVSGRDAMILLEDRWVDPIGGTGGPSYSGQAYDYQAGATETVMRHFVAVNAGQSARSDRKVPALDLAAGDSGSGGNAAVRGRFDNLLVLLQGLAKVADPQNVGLRFWVEEATPGDLRFTVSTPRDNRSTVVFDRRRSNVSSARVTETAPTASATVVAGAGVEPKRTLTEFVNAAEVSRFGRRIERFVDRRDSDDPTEHTKAALAELAAGAGATEIALVPIDGAPHRFGRDYDLGDRVRVYVAEQPFDGIVREVRIGFGADGVVVEPMIGTEAATFDADRSGRAIGSLSDRVGFLERINQFGAVYMVIGWRGPVGEIPVGWHLCDGSTLSNGHVCADYRGRFLVGVDGSHALGATGGSATQALGHTHTVQASALAHVHTILAAALAHGHTDSGHTHPHSHGMSHTHSHSHTMAHTHSHSHTMAHNHTTDIDHDHPNQLSAAAASAESTNSVQSGSGATVNPTNHTHPVNLVALGSSPIASSGSSAANTGSDATASSAANTGSDATASSASSTASDSVSGTANIGSGQPASNPSTQSGQPASNVSTDSALTTINTEPPWAGLYWIERVPVAA